MISNPNIIAKINRALLSCRFQISQRGAIVTIFRICLALMLAILLAYTAVVISNHGWDLLSVFFADMAKMQWPGQFNLDFMFMLTLSGLWVGWRHQFSPIGLGLAVLAFFGGAAFLSTYLLIISVQSKGDVRAILLGSQRVNT